MDNVMKFELLLADGYNYVEAKRRIKDDSFMVFETIQVFKNCLVGECKCEIDMDELRKGHVPDMSAVTYNDHEYIITYIN